MSNRSHHQFDHYFSKGPCIVGLSHETLEMIFSGETLLGDFDVEHTGEYGGVPDPFRWTHVTPLSLVKLTGEQEQSLSGKIIPSLVSKFKNEDTVIYQPVSARYLRITPLDEIASRMKVSMSCLLN